jgi:hypothetical protein
MLNHKINSMTRSGLNVLLLPILLTLSACSEKMAPAGITGYNHMNGRLSIYNFTVNGAMGSNLNQESGGGKEGCCVSIPEKWRSGLKAKIAWEYDTDQTDPNPPPPSQEVEVEIPEYKQPGRLWVHFYDNHQVKLVVSHCSIGHPFYPMSEQDKLPWKSNGTKEDAIESHKRGGDTIDCQ